MIYNERQLKIFKNVKRREWVRQNRLREPYIKQFTGRLKNYFNKLGNGLAEDFSFGSTIMLEIRQNNSFNELVNIFKIQYRVVANAFKNNMLNREQNVKDFDSDFELELEKYINDNVATLVVGINDSTKLKIQNVINNSLGNGEDKFYW